MNTNSLHPYRIHIDQTELDDLRDRLALTRWPDQPAGTGWERGVPVDYLRRLVDYWADGFDWRRQESQLNELPQLMTQVDGQDIHVVHVRSPHPEAVPLLMTHGWPSSSVEFQKVIGPLTDPPAFGGDARDAFHIVAPTLPGYGLSTPMADPGWGNLFRVAQAWSELMSRLGYERYALQSTDVGSGVAGLLAMVDGERIVGSHLTGTTAGMPFAPPLETEGLDAADAERARLFNAQREDGYGYLHQQATRPQTLAYALADSPVAHLAWIVEKFHEWTDPAAALPGDAVDLDHLLTSVTLGWFTRAGASSAHSTYEGMQVWPQMVAAAAAGDGESWEASAGPPVGYAVFAADTTIRSLADPAGQVSHWSTFDRGGHFPAMEVPDLLVEDVRDFLRPLR
ncbi:epoxide hydrolase family protein [Ornithinimicrobium faecis]|uniref:epoxide hydrolase family protein n=1 Tax=Ornithinimicrobium faecis TaxID=2934158 RepID=UPI0021183209|nr:epoxide hydrolase family protein [Ornithinimicrobium sp. HY1745]